MIFDTDDVYHMTIVSSDSINPIVTVHRKDEIDEALAEAANYYRKRGFKVTKGHEYPYNFSKGKHYGRIFAGPLMND